MTLTLSSRLYSKAAIKTAMRRYKDFAKFSVKEGARAYSISITGMHADHKDSLPGEFANFVLLATREGA